MLLMYRSYVHWLRCGGLSTGLEQERGNQPHFGRAWLTLQYLQVIKSACMGIPALTFQYTTLVVLMNARNYRISAVSAVFLIKKAKI